MLHAIDGAERARSHRGMDDTNARERRFIDDFPAGILEQRAQVLSEFGLPLDTAR